MTEGDIYEAIKQVVLQEMNVDRALPLERPEPRVTSAKRSLPIWPARARKNPGWSSWLGERPPCKKSDLPLDPAGQSGNHDGQTKRSLFDPRTFGVP